MPKATTSGQPSLRRNQACRQCRKRKLKCDAQRPHCGTCVKQWHAQTSVPPPVGFAHPIEPQCSYDPLDAGALLNDGPEDQSLRISQLEAQIADLQLKLNSSHSPPANVSPPTNLYSFSPAPSNSSGNGHFAQSPGLSPPTLHSRISAGDIRMSSATDDQKYSSRSGIILPQASLNIPASTYSNSTQPSPIDGPSSSLIGGSSSFPYVPTMIYSGWNQSLPDPIALTHLVETYFRCDPCASQIFHRGSFLASLNLPPTHPDFPHSAVLHAMCASASRWTSQELQFASQPKRRDRFAEFHAAKARSYIDRTMSSGAHIFSVLQACIILSWWFYAEGRWVEVWIFAGFQCRVAIPLGLNYPNTHPKRQQSVYLEPPRNDRDLELRRRAWWMALVFDRLVSAGGWLHAVDERDIGTELPLRQIDFDSDDIFNVGSNPQSLLAPGFFTTHPATHTDSFLLLIKASMLFGRVTDYNSRVNIQNVPLSAAGDRRLARDFQELDALVKSFSPTFPHGYRNYLAPGDTASLTNVDTDLYLAHIIPYAAMITLHSPHLNVTDPECPSVAACITGSRHIIDAYYMIAATSFDITRLHPFIVTVWYLAAVVQVHVCKRMIQLGDSISENSVWGEINLIRYALLQYGALSPIGIRQEKMLRDAMTEILNLTTQSSPLDVKVSLYHGSAKTVFSKTEEESEVEPSAPLPHFSEEQAIPDNSASPPAPNRSIPMIPTVPIVPSISSMSHQHHYSSSVDSWQQQQQHVQHVPLVMSHSPQLQMQPVPLAMSQSPQMQMHTPAQQQQQHVRTNSYGGGGY